MRWNAVASALLGVGVLAAPPGCGEVELADGRYVCDPLVADSCPPGMLCQWSRPHNQHRCFWRLLGDGGVPDAGQCGPQSCDGCCDAEGNCHTGSEDGFCGLGGSSCLDCVPRGRSCERGVCRGDECDCESGGCCDGCYFRPASFHCDTVNQGAEYRCTGSACGGAAERRELRLYCSGFAAECSDQNPRFTAWQTVETCGPDAVCRATAERAWCAVCPDGCVDGVCQGCTDLDGDLTGPGCPAGDDCDDLAPGVTGPCVTEGCPDGWIHVAGGASTQGCADPDRIGVCEVNAMPVHQVTLAGFCIQPTEVSVAAYRACQEAGVCTGSPAETTLDPLCNWTPAPAGRELHPVNCLTWHEAREYCVLWLGASLPTEAQWEKAARGADARRFPWGDEPEPHCGVANLDVDGTGPGLGCAESLSGPGTWEVGSLPPGDGDSPYGLRDLAGNVWEWIQDCWSESAYSSCGAGCVDPVDLSCHVNAERVIRGGGFNTVLVRDLAAWKRSFANAGLRQPAVGFRCVRLP